MKLNIRQIGNSKGVILPANFLKELDIKDDTTLEMELKDDKIIISKQQSTREGWLEACERMNQNQDDELIIPDVFDDENMEDLQW